MKKILFILVTALVLASCSKNYDDYSLEGQKTSSAQAVPGKTCGTLFRKDARVSGGFTTYFFYVIQEGDNGFITRLIVSKTDFDTYNVGDEYCF